MYKVQKSTEGNPTPSQLSLEMLQVLTWNYYKSLLYPFGLFPAQHFRNRKANVNTVVSKHTPTHTHILNKKRNKNAGG